MKIHLELDVAPIAGGPVARFDRVVNWGIVPRLDEYVELQRGSRISCPVENVVFQANGSIRIILATYEEDDADRVVAMLRGESSRWIEHKGE